jgi:hypothetical protein
MAAAEKINEKYERREGKPPHTHQQRSRLQLLLLSGLLELLGVLVVSSIPHTSKQTRELQSNALGA